jgi:hypothetical protein
VRTNVQGVKRYFTAAWSLLILLLVAGAVGLTLKPGFTPDWIAIVFATGISLLSGILGFINGITLFVAREHDTRDARDALVQLNEEN